MDGKELIKIAQETFQTEKITREQVDHIINMLNPSTYMLKYHTLRGTLLLLVFLIGIEVKHKHIDRGKLGL
ncbi:hypothetical protein FMLHJGGC_00150 [Staphylococcus phage BSwM-KMM1]|nr:hypothetical protein FMLHJGGC_00150 [Pseudomonas phage BSwM KMM1]